MWRRTQTELLTFTRRSRSSEAYLLPALDLRHTPLVHNDLDRAEAHLADQTRERVQNLFRQGLPRVCYLFGCCDAHVMSWRRLESCNCNDAVRGAERIQNSLLMPCVRQCKSLRVTCARRGQLVRDLFAALSDAQSFPQNFTQDQEGRPAGINLGGAAG